MKKLIIYALLAMPLLSQAQDKGTATPANKTSDNKFAIENPESIHLDLVISTNSVGGTVIRADFGKEIATSMTDKETSKQLLELRSIPFPSVPDAMNYLSSISFKYLDTYSTSDKEGKSETHILFEKRMMKKPNSNATRPERPTEGTKPAEFTKPADPAKPKPPTQPREKK